MNGFISFEKELEALLTLLTASNELHAKWLNTLSYLENCGARMIAACEHPTFVREEMLKHAAEEFRHAHYLKRQIGLIAEKQEDYALHTLVGGMATVHYLRALDLKAARYLTALGLTTRSVREAAYLLVTYAIEKRAQELYPVYEGILRKKSSPVKVRSIMLEEDEHLREMELGLEKLPRGWEHAAHICGIEGKLCEQWCMHLYTQMNSRIGF